jgi:hypothetical protein
MFKLVAICAAATSLGAMGCLSSAGSGSTDAGPNVGAFDGNFNVEEAGVDAGDATAPVFRDAGVVSYAGIGAGIFAHSTHFSLITKTGMEPGGSGVHSSPTFKVISGTAPGASK